ncbi:MAG TPA: hypothetical protein VNL17_05795 [Verrucomicrobiae bacterium]|nr:hypothetical protein [Verrucomicrobiae bacterium]
MNPAKNHPASNRSRTARAAKKDAWVRAAAYGCDMNLLEASLRRTPAERIRVHQDALDRIAELRDAAKQVFARAAKLGL